MATLTATAAQFNMQAMANTHGNRVAGFYFPGEELSDSPSAVCLLAKLPHGGHLDD